MGRESLFRQEAIDHQNAHWSGKVLLLSGFPAWIAVVGSLLFFIVLILFIVFGSYTRRINVPGEIVTDPHSINLYAANQGIVVKQYHQPNDEIKRGEPLYQLDVSRVTNSGNVSQNAVSSIEEQIQRLSEILSKMEQDKNETLKNLNDQLGKNLASYQQSKKQLNNVKHGMDVMRQTMESYEQYLHEGLISKDQLSAQQSQFYQQQSSYQYIFTQVNQLEMEITKLRSDLVTRELNLDNQISQYQNQRSELERQKAEADATGNIFVNSPVNGRVSSIAMTSGQMVNPGDLLAQLVPTVDYKYQMVLWVPNESVPYVKVGDKVNIRYAAFPYEKFGQFPGQIISIAAAPATDGEMAMYGSAPKQQQNKGTFYKAIVGLDRTAISYRGQSLRLASGMNTNVTLFLENRQLYQWMLSPFYDMSQSLAGVVHE